MNELPILFSGPMIQPIQQDRKTQTRRLRGLKEINESPDHWHLYALEVDPELIIGEDADGEEKTKVFKGLYALFEHTELGECYRAIKCPYGQPGDRLWVRETWAKVSIPNGTSAREIRTVYKADGPQGLLCPSKWKPSIHMPRAASRILLEVVNVRIERLQQINQEDAQCEGARAGLTVDEIIAIARKSPHYNLKPNSGYRLGFFGIWALIHGPESWDANPWVWVITFKRI